MVVILRDKLFGEDEELVDIRQISMSISSIMTLARRGSTFTKATPRRQMPPCVATCNAFITLYAHTMIPCYAAVPIVGRSGQVHTTMTNTLTCRYV